MDERLVVQLPEELLEKIISLLHHDRDLESISLVSKLGLSITNRLKQTLIISNGTTHFLPKLFDRFPNLKNISFSDFDGEPTSFLPLISKSQFQNLSLDLSNSTQFPSQAIRELPISSLRSIKSLKLSNCRDINDSDLNVIAQFMIDLEELDVSHLGTSGGITDAGVDFIASNLSSLRKVNLSGNFYVSDVSVIGLVNKCQNLEEIMVKNCKHITREGVVFALRNCGNLRSVGLLGVDLAVPTTSEALGFAQKLSLLDFSRMSISDELLCAIAEASIPLKKFTLFHCKEFTFSGVLSLLRTYQSLEYFALEGVDWVTDQTIIDISNFLPKANTIKLNSCSKVTSSGLFTLLKNCSMLNSLEMEKTNVGTEEFAVTVSDAKNQHIRVLCLNANKTLRNECLEKVSLSCPNLELIDVSDCPYITRKGIGEVMRRCTSLKHLQISGSLAIRSLGIDLKLSNLEFIQASRSGLNDDGLRTIARVCHGLVNLDVRGCSGVTSEGVKQIILHCLRLRVINLGCCLIEDHDIVSWMVSTGPSLRKVVPPLGVVITEVEKSSFLQRGCLVDEAKLLQDFEL